jgi:hypothetical protein
MIITTVIEVEMAKIKRNAKDTLKMRRQWRMMMDCLETKMTVWLTQRRKQTAKTS